MKSVKVIAIMAVVETVMNVVGLTTFDPTETFYYFVGAGAALLIRGIV